MWSHLYKESGNMMSTTFLSGFDIFSSKIGTFNETCEYAGRQFFGGIQLSCQMRQVSADNFCKRISIYLALIFYIY